MENVIINFTTNTDELDQAATSLGAVEKKDKDLADQAKRTMDAYRNRDKTITDSATNTKKSFDVLADSATKLNKSIIGGTFGDTFQKIRNEVDLTDKQFKIFLQNLQKQAKIDLLDAKTEDEVKELTNTIQAASVAIAQMTIHENESKAAAGGLGDQLKKLYGSMADLKGQGKENSDEFKQMAAAADDLEKHLGIFRESSGQGFKEFSKGALDAKNLITKLDLQLQQKRSALFKEKDVQVTAQLNREIVAIEQDIDRLKNAGKAGFDEFGNRIEVVVTKTITLRRELANLKQELASLESQGLENTQQFEDLSIKAAKLEDQIGDTATRIRAMASDTFVFDAIISGVSGVAGAFSVAQGVIGLFGVQSEEVQKALLKVNSAMAILQGLQQIQNVLQKQSTVMIALTALLRKKDAAAIVAETVAQEGNIVATEGAAVATAELNTAMYANPAVILVGAIIAITTALIAFGGSSETAAEKAEKLNQQLQKQFELLQDLQDPAVLNQQKLIDQLNQQIALRKNAGASDAELANLDLKLKDAIIKKGDLVVKSIEQNAAALGLSVKDATAELEALEQSQVRTIAINRDVETSIKSLKKAFDNGEIGLSEAITQQGLQRQKKVSDAEIKLTESRIALLKSIVEPAKKAEEDVVTAVDERSQAVTEIERKGYVESLKSARAYAEARVLIARAGTEQELRAQVALIRAREREDQADPNLTAGERARITIAANKDIEKAEAEFNKNSILRAKDAVDANVLLTREGSKEELVLKLESLQLQYVADISDKTKSVEQLLLLDNKYTKDREKLITDSNKRIAEDVINTRIAEDQIAISNLTIANADATNQQLLDAKRQLIHDQAALEVLSIAASEKNEELRRAKINAVYAKELLDKQNLERDKRQAEIDNDTANRTSKNDFKVSGLQRQLQNDKLTIKERERLEADLLAAQKEHIDELQDANAESYLNTTKSLDEFNRDKLDLINQSDELEFQAEKTKLERKAALRKQYEELALKAVNTTFSFILANYDNEEARIKQLYDNKQITETQYNSRLKSIQRQRAKAEKELAIFQVLVSEGPAVIKGFQQGGLAGAAAALTLVLALLSQTKSASEPGFRHGGLVDGPGTGTSDSIPIRVSRGEFITKYEMAAKHREALEAINEDRFEKYLHSNHELPELYHNLQAPEYSNEVSDVIEKHIHYTNGGIDYELLTDMLTSKLGNKIGNFDRIAKEVANLPAPFIQFDEDGAYLGMRKKDDITIYKNKKLNL